MPLISIVISVDNLPQPIVINNFQETIFFIFTKLKKAIIKCNGDKKLFCLYSKMGYTI